MSRSIDPVLRDYLRHRIQGWLAADGRTARELAKLAGVSAAQISDAVNEGSIGWKTMMGILPVLGLTLGTLEGAAQQWTASRPEAAPTSQRHESPRLQDRPEWLAVAAAVRRQAEPGSACRRRRRGGLEAHKEPPPSPPPLGGRHRRAHRAQA